MQKHYKQGKGSPESAMLRKICSKSCKKIHCGFLLTDTRRAINFIFYFKSLKSSKLEFSDPVVIGWPFKMAITFLILS